MVVSIMITELRTTAPYRLADARNVSLDCLSRERWWLKAASISDWRASPAIVTLPALAEMRCRSLTAP
jgi:hypothetical protein